MYWAITIGMVGVLQAGLNRFIARDMGVLGATFLNTFLMLILIGVLAFSAKSSPTDFSEIFNFHPDWEKLKWWVLVPPVSGLFFVMGIPALIPRIGAQNVFLGIVVGQMVSSLLWDIYVEKSAFSWQKTSGAALAVLGLIVASWKSPTV